MNWDEIVSTVSPYVVRIETPEGSGTGFLCLYNDDRSWIGIATAAHVVDRAEEWNQPIRFWHPTTQKTKFIPPTGRTIFIDWKSDSAVILLPNDLGLPQDTIPLFPTTDVLPIGAAVGWLGFPAIARNTLCFFEGTISAVENFGTRAYLIDGVAINGVSGGPVIYYNRRTNAVHIVGVLAAYRANRQSGDALPGLSVAYDVSHFHGVVQTVRDIDEAERKKREFDRMIKPDESSPAVLPPQQS